MYQDSAEVLWIFCHKQISLYVVVFLNLSIRIMSKLFSVQKCNLPDMQRQVRKVHVCTRSNSLVSAKKLKTIDMHCYVKKPLFSIVPVVFQL